MKHKDIKIIKHIFDNKSIENKELFIQKIDMKKHSVEIIILHYEYKYVGKQGGGSDGKYEYYVFGSDTEDLFTIRISKKFISENNINDFIYTRADKYTTWILLLKN